jgi:hypothetical protein
MLLAFKYAYLESAYCRFRAENTFSPLDSSLLWLYIIFNMVFNCSSLLMYFFGLRESLGLSHRDVVYMGALALQYALTCLARCHGLYVHLRTSIICCCR